MNDLQLVTLYGQGAVNILAGQAVFRAVDGVLRVPANLVRQAEAAGYRRTRSGQSEAAAGSAPVAPAAPAEPVVEKTETRDDKAARYRAEVEAAGYEGEAVDEIVAERLQLDDLVAEGKTEEEAARIVFGARSEESSANIGAPLEGADHSEVAGEIPAPSDAVVNADVTALSADAAAADKVE